ncbi:MAG: YceI family protein [Piscirickettsiaceae bacterium]|nr:YceI family protein [Piscirickettsiaceae bacterium]
MIKKLLLSLALSLGLTAVNVQAAEHYTIDTKGMHAFVTFKVKHLGYSWLEGRFNQFSGDFDFDEANPSNNKVNITIDIGSLDSNHAERDKHLRSERFFDAKKFSTATFSSTKWQDLGDGKANLTGDFTLRGITKEINIAVDQIGAGKDPWGGFRRGFVGVTTLHLSDYNMKEAAMLGPVAENVQLWLSIEGIRQ